MTLIAKHKWILVMGVVAGLTLNGSRALASQTLVKSTTTQTVDIVLKTKHSSELTNEVKRISGTSGIKTNDFLSPQQFANKYGAKRNVIKQITRELKQNHLKPSTYKGGWIIVVKGTTKNIQRAFHTKLVNIKTSQKKYQRAVKTPKLSKKSMKEVLAITGLTNYSVADSNGKTYQPTSYVKHDKYEQMTINNNSPKRFLSRYGLTALADKGITGRGKTAGIITFANFHPSDAAKYWQTYGTSNDLNRISVSRINGYKGTWSGYDETTNDVEQTGVVAPEAKIRAYIARSNVTGMFNALATAMAENKSDTLSLSWGQSEATLKQEIKSGVTTSKYNQIMNQLFEQAAVQGISVFVAAGDNGSYDGVLDGHRGLSVDSPASSPFVTSVGGTTLPKTYKVNKKTVRIKKERAWGSDFLYPNFQYQHYFSDEDKLGDYFTGGGGGFSKNNARPWYQNGISGTQTFSAIKRWQLKNGSLIKLTKPLRLFGTSSGRNLPDVSANADPNTGYSAYLCSDKHAGKDGEWFVSGGTSVVAPQIAAAFLLLNDEAKGRLGFVNPRLYEIAEQQDGSLNVLDSSVNNTNLYYTGQPGKLYNQATGLGTIDFSRLSSHYQK
ncbi:S53 family peptidase [Lentilactobacillus sp. Marseille-Q4993]|uniref:S53 family peptidase n=1 Tax=Lentilactobacillus sp. Marseille-Q4993 TaxID=3039492 RepID=UPI0024BD1E32|nr:S53 family peptidase [Lentilactobacillus sp. Marseille-Q4993]